MFLAFDIGNSSIGCAVFDGEDVRIRWRMDTDAGLASAVYSTWLGSALKRAGIEVRELDGAIASSVVRGMTEVMGAAVRSLGGCDLIEADSRTDPGIEVAVERPEAVGVDRLLAAGAAFRRVRGSVIVVDVGTALTIDLVSAAGCFMGGAILPGLKAMAKALATGTSLLPHIDLTAPASALGRDTSECIRAGVVFGAAGAVDRVVEELSAADRTPHVLLTGGDAQFLSAYLGTPHDCVPDLVLHGLAHAFRERRRRTQDGGWKMVTG
ncbi:MAG: type III pantothenate kinase [Gemmatimonadota bacterium]|nr:type III pantothenate kinase [Gemmatimonadota bacterium]